MTTVAQVIAAQPLLDARRRVEQIRTAVEDIKSLIVEAYRARDWETLGYANWGDYCTEEFGGTVAIPREERGDVVFTLRDAGLSTRAIGAAIGVTDTVMHNNIGSTNALQRAVDSLTRGDTLCRIARRGLPGPLRAGPARPDRPQGGHRRRLRPPGPALVAHRQATQADGAA